MGDRERVPSLTEAGRTNLRRDAASGLPVPTPPGFRSTPSQLPSEDPTGIPSFKAAPRFDSVIFAYTRRNYFWWMADRARMFGSGLRREHTLADEA